MCMPQDSFEIKEDLTTCTQIGPNIEGLSISFKFQTVLRFYERTD